ncbi:hypothetical protein [Myroides odoratus]|uniref:hypothetical protein n=1 Tax=Myroides odoratus TaxID=256 RepID=UPI003341EACE
MIKKICLLLFSLLLIACKKESSEEIYIKTYLPKILNLMPPDIDRFKKSMVINQEGNLTSWDGEILEKAYHTDDDYMFAVLGIYNKLGIYPAQITIVNKDNSERILYPGFLDINNTKIPLSEIQDWDALFYITSTNCGTCMQDYQRMNQLTTKYADKKIKFVALFDKVKNIENYKKGEIYKTDGFLNDNWIILQKNNLLPFLTEKYHDSLGVPFIFFRKDDVDLEKYFTSSRNGEIEEYISNNFENKTEE